MNLPIYHYGVVERPETRLGARPEASLVAGDIADIDMENLDYKRQIDSARLAGAVRGQGGLVCGMWRGGMFGLATNQVAILSAWDGGRAPAERFAAALAGDDAAIVDQGEYAATVRPDAPGPITPSEFGGGFYVIRWIRMRRADVAEYTQLCLETWPAFEATAACRCYGVFQPRGEDDIQKLLMLTWYGSLNDWDVSRSLQPGDKAKWARRSEMELSHWADAGRLIDPEDIG